MITLNFCRGKTQRVHIFLLSALVLGLLSCGRGIVGDSDPGSTFTLVYPEDGENIWFDPDHPARYLLFMPFFSWDVRGNTTGWLVDGWETSEDGLTWTYRLVPDVLWHDGRGVTARDIEFTFNLYSHPAVGRIDPDSFTFDLIDEYTFAVTYHDKTLDPLDKSRVYLPRHLLEDKDPSRCSEWSFWSRPVGNGPFRMASSYSPDQMVLEANPSYFRGRPGIENVILLKNRDPIAALRNGRADCVWANDNDPALYELSSEPEFQLYYQAGDPFILYWNHNSPLFDDPNTRIALTMAIDRRELYRKNLVPDEFPILDGPVTGRQLRRGDIPDETPYLPIMTDLLLTEAGWIWEEGAAARTRGDQPFRFTCITVRELEVSALFIQEEMKKAGIDMELVWLAEDEMKGRWRAGDFEAAIWEGIDFYRLKTWLIQDRGIDSNIGYRNPGWGDVLREAESDRSPDWRETLNRKMRPLLRTDAPFTFLHPGMHLTLIRRRIKGLSSPFWIQPERHVEFLRIER